MRSLTRSIVLKRVSQGCGLTDRKKLSHPKEWYWNLEHDTACQGMLEQPEASPDLSTSLGDYPKVVEKDSYIDDIDYSIAVIVSPDCRDISRTAG